MELNMLQFSDLKSFTYELKCRQRLFNTDNKAARLETFLSLNRRRWRFNVITCKREEGCPQNMDLPPILPKNKKKPFAIPITRILRAARFDRKLAALGIEKPLEPPKNGLLVPDLVPLAYEVFESWKVLIKGLSQLMHVVPIHGCKECSEFHVGRTGHLIRTCDGANSVRRRGLHLWVKGTIDDLLLPIDCYHMYDPFGHRVKHHTRFDYDRIPAVVELCIQAGVELPQYPSRRRTRPIRMMAKKCIDRGGFVAEPTPWRSGDWPMDFDTAGPSGPPPDPSDVGRIARETVDAYGRVRRGVRRLMRKYVVKACGYCSEVHVGPWGHNVKLCGEFKHQWRDGMHGWQDGTADEVFPPNYVWHVRDPGEPGLRNSLKRYFGKAPAVVEVCVQAGAEIPEVYKPMMRLDIVLPEAEETGMVA